MNEQYEEYFNYLDMVRESGHINMFGAAPYLQEEFGLSRNEARHVLTEWMQSFSEREAAR